MKDGALFSILLRIMLLLHIFKMLCRVSCKALNRNAESGYLHLGKVVKYVSQKLWVSNNSFHWIRKLHTRFQHLDAEAKKILGSGPLKSLLFKKVLDWIRSPNKIVLERCQFLSFSLYNLTAPTEISFCNYLGFGVPIKNFRNPSQRTWKKSFQQDWSYKKRRNILLSDCKH